MRIGLNLLPCLPENRGGWNYVSGLLQALAEYDQKNTYIAFVNSESRNLVQQYSNFENITISIRPTSRVQRVAYENTWLQLIVRRYRLECMHWFANIQGIINAIPAVVTVYDLQPFLSYVDFSLIKRLYIQWGIKRTAKRAALLLPMSQSTARDISTRFGTDPGRMAVIPPVIESCFYPKTDDEVAGFRSRSFLPEKFWLYIAQSFRHKNHLRLFQAYHFMKTSGFKPWPLVLRSDSTDILHGLILELGLENDVIFLPRMERSDLPSLYSTASALVFPSLYEGGGMPVIEAMACGCPIVASNIPPVREFAGDAASYFNPLDVVSISEAIMAFQNNPEANGVKQQIGLERVAEFRAQPIVHKLLRAYNLSIRKVGRTCS